MSDMIERLDRRDWSWVRPVGWGGSLALLLAPFIAMQLLPGSGVNWTVGDFVFLAMLLAIIGLALELVVRASDSWAYRGGATLALAAGSMLLVANGAVGYIGSEDNPYNQLFLRRAAARGAGQRHRPFPRRRHGVGDGGSGAGACGRRRRRLSAGPAHRADHYRVHRDVAGLRLAVPPRGPEKPEGYFRFSAFTAASVLSTCSLQSRSEWTMTILPLGAIT